MVAIAAEPVERSCFDKRFDTGLGYDLRVDALTEVEDAFEVPAAISQGETLAEAKANLMDALKLVLQCQRELAEKELSPNAVRETLEFADA